MHSVSAFSNFSPRVISTASTMAVVLKFSLFMYILGNGNEEAANQ